VRHKNRRDEGRAGGDITPGSTGLSLDGSTAGGLEVTHHLARRAETKLVGLHTNRSQLRKRIRALHYLLKTLKTVFSPSESPDPGLNHRAQKSRFNHDESSEFERNSDTPVTSRTESRETMTGGRVMTEVSTELRRACRIALMESDRPQACEQILQRIHRRESVYIAGFHDPMIAIAQELRKMLADGEVIQKKDGQLWQLNRDPGRLASERKSARK
jgi:hypothetical protein